MARINTRFPNFNGSGLMQPFEQMPLLLAIHIFHRNLLICHFCPCFFGGGLNSNPLTQPKWLSPLFPFRSIPNAKIKVFVNKCPEEEEEEEEKVNCVYLCVCLCVSVCERQQTDCWVWVTASYQLSRDSQLITLCQNNNIKINTYGPYCLIFRIMLLFQVSTRGSWHPLRLKKHCV